MSPELAALDYDYHTMPGLLPTYYYDILTIKLILHLYRLLTFIVELHTYTPYWYYLFHINKPQLPINHTLHAAFNI
jgi:hypothetical protein